MTKPTVEPMQPAPTGYASMGIDWLVKRVEDDDKLHYDLMDLANNLRLFRAGQTMHAYNSFERIRNYVTANVKTKIPVPMSAEAGEIAERILADKSGCVNSLDVIKAQHMIQAYGKAAEQRGRLEGAKKMQEAAADIAKKGSNGVGFSDWSDGKNEAYKEGCRDDLHCIRALNPETVIGE